MNFPQHFDFGTSPYDASVSLAREQWDAMHRQEMEYQSCDYLSLYINLDEECRRKMMDWSFQVMDFCKFDRETAEIAGNFLDRYLSNHMHVDAAAAAAANNNNMTRSEFQLIAMTCLYTAIKIHEPIAIEPKTIASLSGGQFTVEDIEACEHKVLKGLTWRMNPPTTGSFLRLLMDDIVAPSSSPYQQEQVLHLTKLQLSTFVTRDYHMTISTLPSVLATAALSNALNLLGMNGMKMMTTTTMTFSDRLLVIDQTVAERLATVLPHPILSNTRASNSNSSQEKKSKSSYNNNTGMPKRGTLVRYESNGERSPTCVTSE